VLVCPGRLGFAFSQPAELALVPAVAGARLQEANG